MTGDEEDRPNPELLLEAVKKQESTKGRLKIFLGMSAGVGKTYSMLEDAQKKRKEGIDVVVGSIETHGREETARLLEGLKNIPQKWINYKDTVFEEVDLDEILEIKPELVIIDELAHSNVPGSRHPKRWQDVLEILDNGIDVYTTLNVQHIESLKDVIESIAGIRIRETVPDHIVESAASIELVDLTPEELLQRLREGKVYFEEQSAIAVQNFFQEDKLTALREIVLRYAAEKIDHDLHGMVSTLERVEGWKPRDRLLVVLSPNVLSQKLIRTTRRLAYNLNAPWIAVHVNEGRRLSEEENEFLEKNLELARTLGAEVITTNNPDIVSAIQKISRRKGVTQIILGTPVKNSFFDLSDRFYLVEKLGKACPDIDIHVIRQTIPRDYKAVPKFIAPILKWQNVLSYLLVLTFVILFTILNSLLMPWIGYKVVGFIFLVTILVMSLFFRRGPIMFASLLYAIIWGYFFIPPTGSMMIWSSEDTLLLILYFLTAVITGVLVDRERTHRELYSRREQTTQALYETMRDIAGAPSKEKAVKSVKDHLSYALEGSCEVVLKKNDNGLKLDADLVLVNDEKEKNAAIWVFENNKEAGWSTSTLPLSKNLYIPLHGYNETVGILAYRPSTLREMTIEEKNFLYNVAQQLANYLERSITEERTHQAEQVTQVEKVYQTVLKLISTQFQRPFVTIQEAVKELKEEGKETAKFRKIEATSKELINVFDNISAMTKLSFGTMPVHFALHSMQDVVMTCVDNIKKALGGHKLRINIEGHLPLVNFDFYLVQLLLYNLLSNAIQYSPEDSTIEIDVKLSVGYMILSVSDEGLGIPPDLMKAIFEKFYRLPGTRAPGLGLGLSIAKTVAEIHNGKLLAENRPEKGSRFYFCLPLNLVAS